MSHKILQQYIKNPPENLPSDLAKMQRTIFANEGDEEVLINLILDCELKVYATELIDFFLAKEKDYVSTINLVAVDTNVRNNLFSVRDEVLRNIVNTHYSPVQRISAFTCDYLRRVKDFING